MLINYFKLSLRLIVRNPFFTIINVVGLSVGFAVFFVLWPFSQKELESDKFIKDHQSIARIISHGQSSDDGGKTWKYNNVSLAPGSGGQAIQELSGVTATTRFLSQDNFATEYTPGLLQDLIGIYEADQKIIARHKVQRAIIADKNFLEFFHLPMKYGRQETALSNVNSIAISGHVAGLFFGPEVALGKSIKINGTDFQVDGVFEDLPKNTHLQFDWIFSNQGQLNNWNEGHYLFVHYYLQFQGNLARLESLINQNKEGIIGVFLKNSPLTRVEYTLEPLSEVVFNPALGDVFKHKSKLVVLALAIVSIVIIIMAWMNYVGLMLSAITNRYKEIYMRRIIGAKVSDLFLQFSVHSVVVNGLAILLAVTLVQILKHPLSQLLEIEVISVFELDWFTTTVACSLVALGIIFSAAYPTFISTRIPNSRSLAKVAPVGKNPSTVVLPVVQYIIALTLMIWIFIVHSQLNFILDLDLGIDKSNVIVVDAPIVNADETGTNRVREFQKRLSDKLGGSQISLSTNVCGEPAGVYAVIRRNGAVGCGMGSHGGVDENYLPMFGLSVIAGRNFVSDEKGESLIVSRIAATRLGYEAPEKAVGQTVELKVWEESNWHHATIIGVIEDYRLSPFLFGGDDSQLAISGEGLFLTYGNAIVKKAIPGRISIRTNMNDMATSIADIAAEFNQTFPEDIFSWRLLEEQVANQYGNQKVSRNQLTVFTIVAVFIACLGLLGMTSNRIVQKTKEISVRRILGANQLHVTRLLLNIVVVQMGIALLIGLPLAWEFSMQYLQKFTHQIPLAWWHFVAPVAIMIAIMLSTIGSVLWKAVRTNPVDALKQD